MARFTVLSDKQVLIDIVSIDGQHLLIINVLIYPSKTYQHVLLKSKLTNNNNS